MQTLFVTTGKQWPLFHDINYGQKFVLTEQLTSKKENQQPVLFTYYRWWLVGRQIYLPNKSLFLNGYNLKEYYVFFIN